MVDHTIAQYRDWFTTQGKISRPRTRDNTTCTVDTHHRYAGHVASLSECIFRTVDGKTTTDLFPSGATTIDEYPIGLHRDITRLHDIS
ncbi:hypothetical protein D3C86_1166730 [compost metagenome]